VIERYRKWGRVARYERGIVVTIEEAGEALEDGQRFSAKPLQRRPAFDAPDDDVIALANAIHASVHAPVEVERLIVSAGVAEHEFGDARWRDRTARVHVALVNRRLRLRSTLDLGADTCGAIAIDDVATVAGALARASEESEPPGQLIAAPHVTAAILHRLFRIDGVSLVQTAGGRDGKGAAVEEHVMDRMVFPNSFRPSYRVRPVAMPFNLRVAQTMEMERLAIPRITALLDAGGNRLGVLWDDGRSVFASRIEIRAVRAAGPPVRWYPYGAGAFGSELLLHQPANH
jgi:hypothetical protein